MTTSNLGSHGTRSCGCLNRERVIAASTTHGRTRVGIVRDVYTVWRSIKARCLNPSDPAYARYGGRGITVCDRWRNDYMAFEQDMGPRPVGTSIDRIDGNKGYTPENCRWATVIEQNRNRSNVMLFDIDDKPMSISGMAQHLAMTKPTLTKWLRRSGVL